MHRTIECVDAMLRLATEQCDDSGKKSLCVCTYMCERQKHKGYWLQIFFQNTHTNTHAPELHQIFFKTNVPYV